MYNMDGSSPSGFSNSTFAGMKYTSSTELIPKILPDPEPKPQPDPEPKP